jgi:uncharacterized protein YbjQ (UPF0145 family)
MAATESNQDEGSDIFWPGYVDAVTNLVLNLLFVLTIMIVAVLMFAMALSRTQTETVNKAVQETRESTEVTIQQKDEELQTLQQEIAKLKANAIVKNDLSSQQKTAVVGKPSTAQDKNLNKLMQQGGGTLVVFDSDAIAIKDQDLPDLEKLLMPSVNHGSVSLVIKSPKGFSEAKRLAFYRVMSVRSLLIKMGLKQNNIDVRIQEGDSSADNTKVLVLQAEKQK